MYKEIYKPNQLEADKNWMKEFREDDKEKIEQTNSEPKKRGRSRKQAKRLDDQKQRVVQKHSDSPMTRSKAKRKLEPLDENETSHVQRLIEDTSFAENKKNK